MTKTSLSRVRGGGHAVFAMAKRDMPPMAVLEPGERVAAALQRGHELVQASRDFSVRAEGGNDNAAILGRISAAVDKMKSDNESRLDRLEAAVDEQACVAAAMKLNGGGGGDGERPDPDYTRSFMAYARRGAAEPEAALQAANATGNRASIQAAMSVGDNSNGGYVAPVEWDRQIHKAQRARSPMRRICRVATTGVAGYSTLWSDNQWGTGWVGETASRPGTTTPTLQPVTFRPGEIYANPAISQQLLDDAAIKVDDWLSNELADTFDKQEGIAFISGNGVNKPFGLLQYVPGGAAAAAVLDGNGNVLTPAQAGAHPGGNLDVIASGAAATIPNPDALMAFKYGLLAPYRQNATWLMNSQTANFIATMKDATGAYIWKEGLAEDQPTTLLGRPVEIDENMPSIGAGNLAIAFGDFEAGYVINDRIGIRILRDPYTNKPYVTFYATKRVGAGVMDPRAIRLMKIAAS